MLAFLPVQHSSSTRDVLSAYFNSPRNTIIVQYQVLLFFMRSALIFFKRKKCRESNVIFNDVVVVLNYTLLHYVKIVRIEVESTHKRKHLVVLGVFFSSFKYGYMILFIIVIV